MHKDVESGGLAVIGEHCTYFLISSPAHLSDLWNVSPTTHHLHLLTVAGIVLIFAALSAPIGTFMNVYNNTGDAGANPSLESALTKAPSARDAPEKVSFLVRCEPSPLTLWPLLNAHNCFVCSCPF